MNNSEYPGCRKGFFILETKIIKECYESTTKIPGEHQALFF